MFLPECPFWVFWFIWVWGNCEFVFSLFPPPGRAVSLPGVALRTQEPLRQRGEGGLGPLSPSLGGPGTCSTPSGIGDRNPSHTLDAISPDRISTTTRLARCSVSNVRAPGGFLLAAIRRVREVAPRLNRHCSPDFLDLTTWPGLSVWVQTIYIVSGSFLMSVTLTTCSKLMVRRICYIHMRSRLTGSIAHHRIRLANSGRSIPVWPGYADF